MKPAPFTISRAPQGYRLAIGNTITEHRRKRDALSYGLEAIHPRQQTR